MILPAGGATAVAVGVAGLRAGGAAAGGAGGAGAGIAGSLVSLPADTGYVAFLADEAERGSFLALQPIGVVLGGLLFHAAVQGRGDAAERQSATPRAIFTATLLMGVFMESVTGFGVRRDSRWRRCADGAARLPAAALVLLALCLIPVGRVGARTALERGAARRCRRRRSRR